LEVAKKFGQGHLVEHYKSISDAKLKESFLGELKKIDFKQADQLYKDVYLEYKNKKGIN
jgi:hypothetical protein